MPPIFEPFPASSSAATLLADPAAVRYVPPPLLAALSQPDSVDRALLETYIHLVCARYSIGTYLPRSLVAHAVIRDDVTAASLHWVDGALLFADVSGSTALAERLTVLGREGIEIVTSTLNEFFETMIGVTDAYGGDLLAFGGDALLVLFEGANPARTATAAAWELLQRLRGFARTVSGIGTFPLTLHIGVERGEVALASAGQAGALRYWALGSTVNGVAQAEGYGRPGELILGPQSWSEVESLVDAVEVAPGFRRVIGFAPDSAIERRVVARDGSDLPIPALLRQLDQLSPYLPAGLLSRILADPQRPQIEADLRPVSVLFAQVVGLGPIIESMDTTIAAAVVDAFLLPIQVAIQRFGGVVNKVDLAEDGEKILAMFGAPVAYEDHAERAALAALAILSALDDVNRAIALILVPNDSAADVPAFLSLRIGLNIGTVFAGNVGTDQRKEYTVMGDAVNVAARVMAKTPWGEVWCSAATADRISGRMEVEDRGRVAVKGKAEPLALFRIRGERGANPLLAIDQTPLVGREAELALLQGYLAEAAAGHGRVVRISGEAGVGKSRLVAALRDHATQAGMRVASIACLSYTSSIPYAPWSDWLRQICGIRLDDGRTQRREKLAARLQLLGAEQVEWLPLLADMVRLDDADTPFTAALDPQLRQARTFELLIAIARQAAASHASPLLFICEDLHWADQISLDLWLQVASNIADVPFLLLGVHRPGPLWEPGVDDGAAIVALHELGTQESHELLTARLGDFSLPDAVRSQLVLRAAGNPLFLEELLRAVIDKLQRPDRGLHNEGTRQSPLFAPQSELPTIVDDLPESLNGLLLARIDRLDESSRTLLRVASVIGQRFPMGVLQAVQPTDQLALLRQLTLLDDQEMTLMERELPERVHSFRHALLQEVAYQSLLFSRRRELHRRIGEYLERHYADGLESYYGLLAHHYRLSDQHDKAISYLLLAGHAACAEYANDDGIQYFTWALELLEAPAPDGAARPFDVRLWELHGAFGDLLSIVGRYDEALAHYGAILQTNPPPAIAAEAHRDRGSAWEKQGNYAAAFDELCAAEALCRAHLDEVSPLLLSEVCADLGLVLIRRGEYDRAMVVCNEGLTMMRRDARSREDERIEGRLHAQLGNIYGMRGDYPQARYHFTSSLAAQEEIQDLRGMALANNNLGYLWQLQSEYERALTFYRIAEQLARKINLRYALAAICVNIAGALHYVGRYDEADQECAIALEICRSINDQQITAQIQEIQGAVAFCRGSYIQALDWYNQALDIHRQTGNAYQEGATWIHQATAYNALGQHEDAMALAHQALLRAEELHVQQLKVEALNGLAETYLLQGQTEQSIQHATQAADLAASLGSKFDGGIAQRLLGAATALDPETTDRSDAHFQRSIELFVEINQRFELALSHAHFAMALIWREKRDETRLYLQQAYDTFAAIGAYGELQRLQTLIERNHLHVTGSS